MMCDKDLEARKKALEEELKGAQKRYELSQQAVVQSQQDLLRLQGAYVEIANLIGVKETVKEEVKEGEEK